MCPAGIMCTRVGNCMLVSASVRKRWPSENNYLVLSCLPGIVFLFVCVWFFGFCFSPVWIVCFLEETAVFQHQTANPSYVSQKFWAGSVRQQWYLQHCTVLVCASSVLLSDLSHHTEHFSTIRNAQQSIFIQVLTLLKMAKMERNETNKIVWGSFYFIVAKRTGSFK